MKAVRVNHKKGERPPIHLTVRRVEPSVWHLFKEHHYLSAELNKSCKCLLFEWNGVPIAFVAVINTPRNRMPYAMAISRIVVLPDFQGLGLSTMIFNFVGGIVKSLSTEDREYRLFIKTAHRKFGEALSKNPLVRSTTFDKKEFKHPFDKKYRNRLTRKSYCKEYIGPKIDGYQHLLKPISEMRKEKKVEED